MKEGLGGGRHRYVRGVVSSFPTQSKFSGASRRDKGRGRSLIPAGAGGGARGGEKREEREQLRTWR